MMNKKKTFFLLPSLQTLVYDLKQILPQDKLCSSCLKGDASKYCISHFHNKVYLTVRIEKII
jgi:hypothetical protein